MTSPTRLLWQPDREQQIEAAHVLLQGPIPYEVRRVVRELYEQWTAERQPRKECA